MSGGPTLLERLGEAGASATSLKGGMPRWQRVLMVVMALAVVGFLAAAISSQWTKLPDIDWRFEPGWLLLSLLALIVFQAYHAQLWVLVLHRMGAPVRTLRGWAVWSVTLVARYVPANVALAMGRIALAEREGVPKRVTSASLVYELGFTFAGAAIVGCYFIVTLPDLEGQPARWLALAIPVVTLTLLDPAIFHRLADGVLRRLGRAPLPLPLSRLQVAWFTLLFVGSFLVAGLAVYCFAQGIHGVDPSDMPTVVGAYSVGFAASVIAFVLPGGLGARETAMAAALAPAMPFTVALAVAVGVRLVQMAVEVLYAVVAPLVARRR